MEAAVTVRASELLFRRNHAYLLGDMRRHGIPLGYHTAVANLIREYVQAHKEST